VGRSVKVEVCMCRFAVLSMAQRTVGSPVNIVTWMDQQEVVVT
jgi:hypothetical protein